MFLQDKRVIHFRHLKYKKFRKQGDQTNYIVTENSNIGELDTIQINGRDFWKSGSKGFTFEIRFVKDIFLWQCFMV